MDKKEHILIVGENTVAGLALRDELMTLGYTGLIRKAENDVDWSVASQTQDFFSKHRPEYVFLLAGKSGGIDMNTKQPATLMADNILISANVIMASHKFNVKKLLYLASSCCYPRECPQPMKPEYLMTGLLEPTNEAYATAKLAGVKMCQAYRRQYGCNYITVIPSNPFGPGDKFDAANSHVIEALILKMHNAKIQKKTTVDIWGTGKARRDFIYSKDLASACICSMKEWDDPAPINAGCNTSISIATLAETIRDITGFNGDLVFDAGKPDGTPTKILDSSQLHQLGWKSCWSLKEGLTATYEWYKERAESISRI